jgi:hypothetical protein
MTNYLAPKTSLRPKSRKDSKGYEPLVEEGSTRGLFPLSKPTADDMRIEGGNRESARVAREDSMYLRPKARKNKK